MGTIGFTVGLTLVCTGLIESVNAVTRTRIEENKTLFVKKAVRQAAGLEKLGRAELSAWFDSSVTTNAAGNFLVDTGDETRLVMRRRGAGLWGTIYAMVGFSGDRNTITGFAVEEHSETPGLGARMEEPWFSSQFNGKTGPFTTINPEPKDKQDGHSAGDHEMDAITGATITTKAVKNLINKSLEAVDKSTTASHE
jgi:Na+-transporting NADH:ubiquinone oxidoreductase subunit C